MKRLVEWGGLESTLTTINNWYEEGTTDKDQTEALMRKYWKDDDKEVFKKLDEQDYKKETGSTEGYSIYMDLEEAVKSGTGIQEAKDELTSIGYTVDQVDDKVWGIVKELYVSGEFTRSKAESLLRPYYDNSEKMYRAFAEFEYIKKNGSDKGYSVYGDFRDAVSTGKNLRAVISTYMDPNKYGYEDFTLKGEITKYFKPKYLEAYKKGNASSMKGYLINAFVMLGDTEKEASKKIDAWLKD
jgi:hypothetical protein